MNPVLWKELRSLSRERIVILSIILPFVIYSSMAPFMGELGRQAREAASLQGVKLAFAACDADPGLEAFMRLLVAKIRSSGNVTAAFFETCDALPLLEKGYNVVVVFNGTLANISTAIYVRGSLESLAKTLSLPAAVAGALSGSLAGVNATRAAYIYIDGRLYSFSELEGMFNTMVTMGYALLFVLFPAANVAAAMIGSEREEKMLDVLLSLPVSRRSIALSKIVATIIVAVLTALSAVAGLVIAMSSAGQTVALTRYYQAGHLLVYLAAATAEALFVSAAAMVIALFASTMRGAQAAASIVVLPAIIPPMMVLTGLSTSGPVLAVPYMAGILAALSPLAGLAPAAEATVAQAVEAVAALLVLERLLGSEVAVTGPETLKKLAERLRARRGRL